MAGRPRPAALASAVRPLRRSAFAVALLLLCGSPAFAAGTNPTLALAGAQSFASSAGVVTVQANGQFNFDDVLQFSFPCGIVVYQGDRFALYDYSGTQTTGTAAFLSDGLISTEMGALVAAGAPAVAPAGLLRLQPTSVTVALPPGFSPGAASVVVYAFLEGTYFLSNIVGVVLP